jgi:hypothetical protein
LHEHGGLYRNGELGGEVGHSLGFVLAAAIGEQNERDGILLKEVES